MYPGIQNENNMHEKQYYFHLHANIIPLRHDFTQTFNY